MFACSGILHSSDRGLRSSSGCFLDYWRNSGKRRGQEKREETRREQKRKENGKGKWRKLEKGGGGGEGEWKRRKWDGEEDPSISAKFTSP